MEKLKFLPFNIFWCLPTFAVAFLAFYDMPLQTHIWLSLLFYAVDVKSSTNEDYLLDKIKSLEKNDEK